MCRLFNYHFTFFLLSCYMGVTMMFCVFLISMALHVNGWRNGVARNEHFVQHIVISLLHTSNTRRLMN